MTFTLPKKKRNVSHIHNKNPGLGFIIGVRIGVNLQLGTVRPWCLALGNHLGGLLAGPRSLRALGNTPSLPLPSVQLLPVFLAALWLEAASLQSLPPLLSQGLLLACLHVAFVLGLRSLVLEPTLFQ